MNVTELLDHLDALHAEATPGPWTAATAALRAVAELADFLEAESTERQEIADRLPDQPAYHMEINRLVVAAEHQRRAAKQIRRALATLTPEAVQA